MDVATMDETVHVIEHRITCGLFTQHVVVNVAKIVHMQSNRDLAESVRACNLINIDGMGVVWAAKLLGYPVSDRVTGIDLFDKLLEMAARRKFPVYFLGASEGVVSIAVDKLRNKFPDLVIAGFNNGYFWGEEEKVVKKIRNSGARLLFVAISSPKKEQFIDRWKSVLGVDFAMGVGGTFDIVAGKTRRAPYWMQRSGLEWLYRVIQEPGRMWKRYLKTNLAFAWMLLRECFVRRKNA